MKISVRLLIALLVVMIGLCPAAMASSLDAAMPTEEATSTDVASLTEDAQAMDGEAGAEDAVVADAADAADATDAADTADAATSSGTGESAVKEPAVRWAFGVSLTALQSPCMLLVNEENLLDEDYEPAPLIKMTSVKRATSAAIYLEETTAKALVEMFQAALAVEEYTYTTLNSKGNEVEETEKFRNGMVLYLKSGYRSYGTQKTTYNNYLARNNNVDDGYVAKPGASEHQSGLCCDILDADWAARSRMTQDFKYTAAAQWMKENCARYGFILRFPEDQEAATGIKFEPWHFRYVGKEVAGFLTSTGMTLEEFTEDWKAYLESYLARGGNIEEQLAYEESRLYGTPESYILDEYGVDGDAEISLMF